MTGGSLGVCMWSYGTLPDINGVIPGDEKFLHSKSLANVRKNSTKMFSGFREKERSLPSVWCRCLGCRKISMLLLIAFALLVFVLGSLAVDKETISLNVDQQIGTLSMVLPYVNGAPSNPGASWIFGKKDKQNDENYLVANILNEDEENRFRIVGSKGAIVLPSNHPCTKFTFPPPPPPNLRRIGPRPCPVCYLPVDQAIASMPSSPSASPVLQNLTYVHDENPIKTEPHGGSDFGGYPSIKQRSNSFDVKESMTVHCGFVKRSKPGLQTGFDFDESDLAELQQFHDIIVASAIFGNYDVIQQPRNVSEEAKKNIPFYMFIDEETEAYIKNKSILESSKRVGLWRIVVVRNVPYSDARRNGKVPKLLLHRIFPNVRYSIWIDGKLQLVVDPYQILEKFLWRQNANFAISRHYRRFDVFVEAEANKAAGKYDNSSIDEQVGFYKQEGLTPYSEAKFPITSDVPEGCVLIKEHIPITNLFTCLWFNEVDRFTSRDQLSFAIVRDKIMAKVDWNINMFLDCERRNFVIQTYHRDLLEQMPPPVATVSRRPPGLPSMRVRTPGKRVTRWRSSSRRHRKAAGGNRDQFLLSTF
ncbi:probable hexosyltransferase MUCI70 [Gossypium arboreum]|uniref:probable hexosyltransferase MUCI70 n=1 Tax=Gossypium arboreum TaxID=29729 RepID=UPI0022F15F25|nr:probable hexosyltransferase MUCI70 [Gossypium arboreum]XP_052883838.1 probable hexosyltransferase MUCI70 [Gossypium arboreum]XP_052883839.1 probable hexosyltransferase MUCI70 [Gossypium arboreum]XP_052883840.1 probable hexosyltransferase MUCI70 [Gossypium arboreum]